MSKEKIYTELDIRKWSIVQAAQSLHESESTLVKQAEEIFQFVTQGSTIVDNTEQELTYWVPSDGDWLVYRTPKGAEPHTWAQFKTDSGDWKESEWATLNSLREDDAYTPQLTAP